MANLLSSTTVGGSAVITTSNIGSYAITSLSGYATQSWVQSQGYLTSVPAQSWASITSKPFLLTLNYDQGSPWAGNTGGSGRNLVASFHGASGNSVITFGSGNGDLNLSVDGNVYVNEGQDILASRTWVSTSGNAATATTFSSNRTNYKNNTDNAVAGQLMWKAYGNNHTIFDASASTAPDGTSVNNTNSAVAWTGTYPTLMGWNGSTTYGVRVDSARVADTVTTAPTVYWNSIVGKPTGNTRLVQFGDYINQPTFAGKTLTMHPSTIKTLLWGGNGSRYTVTTSTTGTYPQAGSTYIVTYELIDGSNSVYSSGNIYCGFWNNCPPTNITVRVQNTSGTWYGPYQGSNIGVGYFEYWKIPCGGPNFIKAWEITFTPTAGCNVALMTVDIVIDNSEGIDQDPFVSRGGSSMLGNLTLSGGATLNLTGSANKVIAINPGNGYDAMIRYNGGSGTNWYVGKRNTNQLVDSASFHFYSDAAGQTVAGIDTSGNSFAIGSFRAPVFYDSNDTNYYGNFNGTSVVNSIRFGTSTNNSTFSGDGAWGIKLYNDNGYIQFGPANTSHAHIYTDRANFYFNKDILINGNSVITTSTIGSQTAGSVTGLTLTSSANNLNPDNVTQNQIGYNTSVSLFGQTDGGLYSSAYSSSWIHQIYGDFRSGQIAVRGKNNGTWQSWRTILDSGNYTSYSPSLTGSGASGTWGISITGNSAYATNSTRLYASDSPYTYGGAAPYYMYMNYDGGSYWELKVSPATPGAVRVAYSNNSGAVGNIDVSRIVYGDGARGRSTSKIGGNANTSDSSNSSGFYFGNAVAGMPSTDWWNWLTVAGNSWSGGDGYAYQMAGSFWGDDFRLRRMTSGTWNSWLTIIHSGNIGSQSVNYATTAGALSSMNISQFSNNSGYLTGITSGQVTGALGYTPYNSSNPNGYITSSGSISGNAATATTANALTSMNISQFTNNSGYLTSLPSHNHDDRYYTESEIDSQISGRLYQASVNTFDFNAFNGTGLYRGSTGSWSNRPPSGHNGGAVLQIDTHPGNYHSQLYFDTGAERLYFRNANAGTWGNWLTVLHSSNFNLYSPSLTGSNASGTWNINVTGSAGSVAWTNVSSRPTALSQFTNDLGNLSSTGGTITGDLNLQYSYPRINFYDTDNDSDYSLINNNGNFSLYDINNNVHRFVVLAGGNVGINTTSPANLLTVNGSTRIVTHAQQGLFGYDDPTGGSFIWSITRYTDGDGNDLNINALAGFAVKTGASSLTNSGHQFYINSSGNVGIGTRLPVGQLNVFGGTGNNAAILTLQSQSGGNGNTGIYFRPYQNETFANSAEAQAAILAQDASYSAHIKFLTKVPGSGTNSLTERMRLTSTGNLLIGTTTDNGFKLTVSGTANITNNVKVGSNTFVVDTVNNRVGIGGSATPSYTLEVLGKGFFNEQVIIANGEGLSLLNNNVQIKPPVINSLGFYTGTSGANERMRITPSGNVGINTTSPTTLLNIKGTSTTSALASFKVENFSGDPGIIVNDAGNLLVGTASDSGNRLEVNGTVNATGYKLNGVTGYTGMVTIQQAPPMPPITFDIQNGIIMSVT